MHPHLKVLVCLVQQRTVSCAGLSGDEEPERSNHANAQKPIYTSERGTAGRNLEPLSVACAVNPCRRRLLLPRSAAYAQMHRGLFRRTH